MSIVERLREHADHVFDDTLSVYKLREELMTVADRIAALEAVLKEARPHIGALRSANVIDPLLARIDALLTSPEE